MQINPSSYSWQRILDFTRRLGASAAGVSNADGLMLAQMVSSRMYTFAPWEFTLTTTVPGQFPCVDGQQDYAMPADCYRLVKAWFYLPTQNGTSVLSPANYPTYAAYLAAVASASYVGTSAVAPGQIRDLDVVKNISVDLNPRGPYAIDSIAQVGNAQIWRLSCATSVPSNVAYEIQAQYQPFTPKFTDLSATPWFPDDYMEMAQAGILYYLYQFTNDPRAGTAETGMDGGVSYTGQLAVWRTAMESAAKAEREGSVDTFTPGQTLGTEWIW